MGKFEPKVDKLSWNILSVLDGPFGPGGERFREGKGEVDNLVLHRYLIIKVRYINLAEFNSMGTILLATNAESLFLPIPSPNEASSPPRLNCLTYSVFQWDRSS